MVSNSNNLVTKAMAVQAKVAKKSAPQATKSVVKSAAKPKAHKIKTKK